jgi:hypothetical protein
MVCFAHSGTVPEFAVAPMAKHDANYCEFDWPMAEFAFIDGVFAAYWDDNRSDQASK